MTGPSEVLAVQSQIEGLLREPGRIEQAARAYGGSRMSLTDSQVRQLLIEPFARAAVVGSPYYATADAMRVISSGAVQLEPADVTLTADLLPTTYGFWHHEIPEELVAQSAAAAILWGFCWCHTRPYGREGRLLPEASTPLAADSSILVIFLMRPLTSFTLPVPMGLFRWRLGISLAEAITLLVDSMDDASAQAEGIDRRLVSAQAQLFAASLLFISQRVLVVSEERPDRPERRRFERQFPDRPEPTIRVVALPVRHYSGQSEADHPGVNWSVRWLVRGHWRRQPYPASGTVRPKWIAPYVKGPEGLPVKSASTLYRVQPARSRKQQ